MRLTARLACSGEMQQPGGHLAPEDPCRTNNLRMDWAASFYDRQGSWTGLYVGDPDDYYQAQAARIARLAPSARTVLELAAGGGQAAAAAADQGHLVTAIELVDRAARNAERLAETRPDLTIIQADMYEVDLGGNRFDAVVYWDGFGLGSDADQIVLLKRITSWLQADGRLLLDAYTPWYWAAAAGQESVYGRAHSRYDFDARGCRMLDRWWHEDSGEDEAVEQSLRCYSPADLALLAGAAGLEVLAVEPGGAVDYDAGTYEPEAPLRSAMSYAAALAPAGH